MLFLLKVFTAKAQVLLATLMTVVIITLKVIQLMIEWWVDSLYLAKCIYNNGCNAETVLQDIPAYIQPLGSLDVSQSEECKQLNMKYWTKLNINVIRSCMSSSTLI